MKIRAGFVSNSSSASFIVKFKSQFSRNELESLIRKSDEWLNKLWDETEQEVWDWSDGFDRKNRKKKIEKITPLGETFLIDNGNGEFTVKTETTMMNDWTDLAAWQLIRALHEGRIPNTELIENRQVFEDHYDCDKLIEEFDKYCWEYDSYVNKPYGKIEPHEIEEAKIKQEEVEYEYLSFLSHTGAKLTDEETLYLSKSHLIS